MKIQGTFLTSRAGRRIFWTLLLAAAIPLFVFGAGTYKALSDHFEAQTRRTGVHEFKISIATQRSYIADRAGKSSRRTRQACGSSRGGNTFGRRLDGGLSAPRRCQIELPDREAEEEVINDEVGESDRY